MTTPNIPYVDLAAHNRALKGDLLAALGRVIEHGQFILGPEVSGLEEALAKFLGVPHVVGVSNGTDALVMGLRLAGIKAGDEVVCPSHSFVATATAVRLVGATPVFADVDAETMNLDPIAAETAITSKTTAVMPVHMNGAPAAVDALAALCERRKLVLIEDCAQAIGARARGRSVGTLGIGCFSLHPLKVLSALGDAGFITVKTEAEAARLRQMRNLGLRDRDHCDAADSNMRLDALQAALVRAKLPHVPGWIEARRAHARAYREALANHVRVPHAEGEDFMVYSAFVVRHPRRDALIAHLATRGIEAKVHYPVPIHRQRAFEDLPSAHLPVTDAVCASIVSLPVTPELSPEGRVRVIEAVLEFERGDRA